MTNNYTGTHDHSCLHEGFTDVAPNGYYAEAVDWAFERGIATGYSSDLFGPHEPVLRWHMAAFLWRYRGQPSTVSSSHFSDLEGLWYADAVNWMAEARITAGTEGRRFEPDAALTRAQVITFLWRMAGRPHPTSPIPLEEPVHPLFHERPYPFDDVAPNAYFRQSAHWAELNGISEGVGERTFGGDLPVDRAQALTFLYRYNLLTNPEAGKETENPEDTDDTNEGPAAHSAEVPG